MSHPEPLSQRAIREEKAIEKMIRRDNQRLRDSINRLLSALFFGPLGFFLGYNIATEKVCAQQSQLQAQDQTALVRIYDEPEGLPDIITMKDGYGRPVHIYVQEHPRKKLYVTLQAYLSDIRDPMQRDEMSGNKQICKR